MGPADFALSDIGVSPHKFWRDAEQFLSRGGGWCIEHAGGVVAMAFTSFRFGAQLEIGIETRAAYRGQGLAVHAACALLDQCVTLGLEPVWSCRKENQGSYNLAKSLGFQPTIEAPYYHLPAANAAQ
jgi:RimJ/RimL family protein N-acetyltransferase